MFLGHFSAIICGHNCYLNLASCQLQLTRQRVCYKINLLTQFSLASCPPLGWPVRNGGYYFPGHYTGFSSNDRWPIGTKVVFYCYRYYYVVNTTTTSVRAVCNASGQWSQSPPTCTYGGRLSGLLDYVQIRQYLL